MRTPLVLHTLLHQRRRTLLAVAGVGIAVTLVFMQLGFLSSAEAAATVLLDRLDFDLILLSAEYQDLNRPESFPRRRLEQALGHPDVAGVSPLHLGTHLWLVRRDAPGGRPVPRRRRPITVIGVDPAEPVFRDPTVFPGGDASAALAALREPGAVLMDTRSRDYFGARDVGLETELGRKKVTIVGHYAVGTGYGSDGAVMTSDRTYAQLFGPAAEGRATLGLIRLRPEARGRADDVRRELLRDCYGGGPGGEVRLLTRADMAERERRYWVEKTSVGLIFRLGVVVAFLVGTSFVYQVISGDIVNRLDEYATLKALGYGRGYLSGSVLRQALLLGAAGYAAAFGLTLVLYEVSRSATRLPLHMTAARAGGVLALAAAMCAVSGLLAVRKAQTADPASLF
jgi:putative ABC transport system permease protein